MKTWRWIHFFTNTSIFRTNLQVFRIFSYFGSEISQKDQGILMLLSLASTWKITLTAWVDSTRKEQGFPSWRNVAWKAFFLEGLALLLGFCCRFGRDFILLTSYSFHHSTKKRIGFTTPLPFSLRKLRQVWDCFASNLTFGQFGFQALGRNNNNLLLAGHASEKFSPLSVGCVLLDIVPKEFLSRFDCLDGLFPIFHQPNFFTASWCPKKQATFLKPWVLLGF